MSGTRPLLAVFCLCTLAHAQSGSSDQVYSYDPKIVNVPVPVVTAEAQMPEAARRQQLPGFCSLEMVVNKNGLPQDPRVVRCTDPIFAENSLNAAKNYRFKPATTVEDNKPVLFRLRIDISFRFGSSPGPVLPPRPKIRVEVLVPSQPTQSGPDSAGIYTLSHDFDSPNSLPKLQRFANAGFGRAAFSLDDGVGCIAEVTLDETGTPTNVQVTKCDDPSLQKSAERSLSKSQFSPAILSGKPVPVRASLHLVCEGFGPPSEP